MVGGVNVVVLALTGGARVAVEGRVFARPNLGWKTSTPKSSSFSYNWPDRDEGGSATSSWLSGVLYYFHFFMGRFFRSANGGAKPR